MKLPKGHIVKTAVKHDLEVNSIEELIGEIVEDSSFTGYIRILGDNGEDEEEIKIIIDNGGIFGGERNFIGSGKTYSGNQCNFSSRFHFQKCGISVVRLNSDDVEMIKISYPNCLVTKDLVSEEPKTNHRDEVMKKYRIKDIDESDITDLLEKLNGD
ncbi:MAG TPA: DUF2226 domain-containing protein [Methanofastidiosum sp.]|nr:DUF2226 domain-containing protein [Methanofastidiosum sp.]